MTATPSIRIVGIGKSFGGNKVLHDCHCEIRPHQVTCLVGPNGAGKSTLFNIATGFLSADKGEVRYGDTRLDTLSPVAVHRLGIVRSFQGVRVFRRLSVLENLMLARGARDWSQSLLHPLRERRDRQALTDRAWQMLEDIGLTAQADRTVGELSYAEQKLLSIGCVTMTDAAFILLDEPLAGLDEASVDLFVRRIRQLAASGRSVCVVEHNLGAVRKLADEIVFMAEGTVKAVGPTEELLAREDLTRIYLGVTEVSHA